MNLFTKQSHRCRKQRYYLAIKKNEIMPCATVQMDPKIVILSEVSQKEKDKYHTISFICGI